MGIFDWLFGGKKTTPPLKKETIVVENKEKVNSHNFFQLNLNSINKEEIRFQINNTNNWISQLSKNLEKDKNEYIKFYSPKDSCEKVFYEWEAVKVLLNQLKKTRNIEKKHIQITWKDEKYKSAGDEDIFIINYFNRKRMGFLLDIACACPVSGSLTFKLLNNYFWEGILVEPSYYHKKNIEACFVN